ncbi:coiled-coil-helix-coiled-coil-helix domain-containing protein 1 [Microplitis demolitor]|uniref:coiled-coil-helix-coiled-coil-helix domain-containing protein 1 n=1 Tax=Microplitis demolitor TaxID=69319 RepID=UPI0004CCC59B|nr:coiled-coil-helix-coiled-coil-helix domain-containing protein 1 [Microplitis demolitor]
MKWTECLQKYARSPQNPNKVKFVPQLPLALRNRVTGKNSKQNEKGCLQEVSIVLACLKDNDFENSMCTKEIDDFNNCFKTYTKNKEFAKAEARKGNLVPGAKNLKYMQINKLLSMHPQENVTKKRI